MVLVLFRLRAREQLEEWNHPDVVDNTQRPKRLGGIPAACPSSRDRRHQPLSAYMATEYALAKLA